MASFYHSCQADTITIFPASPSPDLHLHGSIRLLCAGSRKCEKLEVQLELKQKSLDFRSLLKRFMHLIGLLFPSCNAYDDSTPISLEVGTQFYRDDAFKEPLSTAEIEAMGRVGRT